jgi:hypothetical protein
MTKAKTSIAEDAIRSWSNDYELHAKDCLKIRDHNTSAIVPLVFNASQRICNEIAEKLKDEVGYVRIMLLKARRFGGSTWTEGRFYSKTSLNLNMNAFIVAHERESTNTLFEMSKLMHQKNPIAPATLHNNEKALKFDNKEGTGLKSEYRVACADNTSAGRSQGVHFLHACLHKDSLVVLSNGSTKTIGDINVGEVVVTGNGHEAQILKKFDTGEKQTYEVGTWLNNQPVKMSADHKVYTVDGVKVCSDLSNNDWILVPKIKIDNSLEYYNYELDNLDREQGGGTKHIESTCVKLNRGFGYYLGYYLAEGCIKKQYNSGRPCAVHFAYHEDETFIDKADRWFAEKYYTSRKDSTDETKRKRTYFYGTFLAGLTNEIVGATDDKCIPSWFFKTNDAFLHGLVEGYLDGDGSKTQKRRVGAVCIREKISRQIRRILISLDYGVASIAYRENRERYGKETQPIYSLEANGDTWARWVGLCVEKPHKATKYKRVDGKYYVKVRHIKKSEIAQTFDMEVDHEDHNFETTIGVVSNSEEAFWRDGETLLKGLMQTIPDPPAYSEVVRESTAQGYGNSFQVDCFAAYGEGQHPYYSAKLKDVAPHMPDSDIVFHFAYRAPGQDWVLVFIPWFMHERYTREFDSPQQKLDFATKIGEKVFDNIELQWVESEASKLRRQYGLTLEQLNWREWAIKNKCRDNIRTFREEYPATVEEAFLSTGTNVYPKELCDEIEMGCEEPILIGDPLVRGNKTRVRRNPNGKLRIWEVPDKNSQYFMCVDSGGGKNERQKKEKTDPDPTCIDVWNHRSGQQAAQWHGHIEYDMIGDIVEMVGNMFNRCMACVELMNHGYTVVADLKRARYPMFEARPNEPGWLTTAKSKPLMVDDLYRMSRDGQLQIKNKATVSEMRTFKEENGKFNAETGCHDERVDTAGMASQMFQMLPRYIVGNEPQGVEFSNLRDRSKREDDGYQEIYTG